MHIELGLLQGVIQGSREKGRGNPEGSGQEGSRRREPYSLHFRFGDSLRFGPPILEPDLDLPFGQVQVSRQFPPAK